MARIVLKASCANSCRMWFRSRNATIETGSSSILVLHGTCNPLLCHASSRSATKPIGSDCRQRGRLSYTALTATYRANNCYILTKTSRNVVKLGPLPATQPDSAAMDRIQRQAPKLLILSGHSRVNFRESDCLIHSTSFFILQQRHCSTGCVPVSITAYT